MVAAGDAAQTLNSRSYQDTTPPTANADFLVVKGTFGAGNTDQIDLFVNKTSEDLGANVSSSATRNVKFNRLVFASYSASTLFDELRVGTTFAAVAPPSALPPPNAPTALNASSAIFYSADLTWTDNATNEVLYTIERSPDGLNPWVEVGATDAFAGNGSYQDIGLSEETPYFYRVYASNSGGNSGYSNVVSATTAAMPADQAQTIYIPFSDSDPTVPEDAVKPAGISTFYQYGGTINAASALTFPGLITSGNGLSTVAGSNFFIGIDTAAPLFQNLVANNKIGGTGRGTLYLSWLVRGANVQATNALELHGAGPDNIVAHIGTRFDSNSIALLTSSSSTSGLTNYNDSNIAPSATNLYVARITFGPGNTTNIGVFIDQLEEGTPNMENPCYARFNTISFNRQGGATAPDFDEVRIGLSYADVVPADVITGLATFRSANGLPVNGSGDLAEPAGDGVSNLEKYAFNMIGEGAGQASSVSTSNVSVLTPGSTAGLPRLGIVNGRLTITYIIRSASSDLGITYIPQFGDSPASLAFNPLAGVSTVILDANLERVTVTDSVAAPSRFARVGITAP